MQEDPRHVFCDSEMLKFGEMFLFLIELLNKILKMFLSYSSEVLSKIHSRDWKNKYTKKDLSNCSLDLHILFYAENS